MGARPVPPMGAEHCSPFEIGRASGRGRGEISGGGVSFKKKKKKAMGRGRIDKKTVDGKEIRYMSPTGSKVRWLMKKARSALEVGCGSLADAAAARCEDWRG